MSTHKKIDLICIAAILPAIVLAVLFMNGKAYGIIPTISEESANDFFTANDLNAQWDTSSATKIVLSDNGSVISGNGAYIYEGNIIIVYPGHYVLTGELTNGSVVIDADKTDKIWISLDGVSIHCEDDAAIRIEQADKVFLTLADGTENTISSGAQYNDQVIASGVDGTIYSRDDLTINGSGSLAVKAEYYHGIVCNDDLVVAGGNITINAVQDGIHANDSVRVRNCDILISAGDDGITVSNDDETSFLYVESGSITIPACYEGLEAIDITIAGGTINITPTDDGINASGRGDNSVIRITGGDITIINPSGRDADGLDSNGSIYIEGGKVFISVTDNGGNCALDYGSENGGECVISGGTVIACGGSSMAEGFDAASPQGFLMYNTSAAAGALVSLMDSDGDELLSQEIPCSFSSVVLSVPDLKIGDICTIEIAGVQEQITINNASASHFVSAGMFGNGMRNGRDSDQNSENRENRDKPAFDSGEGNDYQGDMQKDTPLHSGGPDFADRPGTEAPNSASSGDMELPGGLEFPDGMEPPGSMEAPDGSVFPGGMEAPDGSEFPDGMEAPDGSVFPGGMEAPDGSEFPDGMEAPDSSEFPGSTQPSGRADMHAGGKLWDTQKMEDANGRLYAPDSSSSSILSDISSDKLALLGVSMSVLLIGLFVALKIKH